MTSQPVIQGLVEFPVDDLAPYHRNPRRGDVKAVGASMTTSSLTGIFRMGEARNEFLTITDRR